MGADDIGVELWEVWIAKHTLEDIAGAHDTASSTISAVSGSFDRAPELTGTAEGPYTQWATLRDNLAGMAGVNSGRFATAAEAIQLALDGYAAVDEAGYAEFERLRERVTYEDYENGQVL